MNDNHHWLVAYTFLALFFALIVIVALVVDWLT
jgi:hypothetical protein